LHFYLYGSIIKLLLSSNTREDLYYLSCWRRTMRFIAANKVITRNFGLSFINDFRLSISNFPNLFSLCAFISKPLYCYAQFQIIFLFIFKIFALCTVDIQIKCKPFISIFLFFYFEIKISDKYKMCIYSIFCIQKIVMFNLGARKNR
jgi:hypothetical protein